MDVEFKYYHVGSFPHLMTVRVASGQKLVTLRNTAVRVYSAKIFDNVSKSLNPCTLGPPLSRSQVRIAGTPCIARIDNDCLRRQNENKLFRAVIRRFRGNTCKVLLVDYGEEASCPCGTLYDIHQQPSYTLRAPMAAFRCFLDKVGPRCDLEDTEKNFFLTLSLQLDVGVFRGVLGERTSETSALPNPLLCSLLDAGKTSVLNGSTRPEVAKLGDTLDDEEKKKWQKEAEEAKERTKKLEEEKQNLQEEWVARVKMERESNALAMDAMRREIDSLSARADSLSICVPIAARAMDMCALYMQSVAGTPSVGSQAHFPPPLSSTIFHPLANNPGSLPLPYHRPSTQPVWPSVPVAAMPSAASRRGAKQKLSQYCVKCKRAHNGFCANSIPFLWNEETGDDSSKGCAKCKQLDHQLEECPLVWRKPSDFSASLEASRGHLRARRNRTNQFTWNTWTIHNQQNTLDKLRGSLCFFHSSLSKEKISKDGTEERNE